MFVSLHIPSTAYSYLAQIKVMPGLKPLAQQVQPSWARRILVLCSNLHLLTRYTVFAGNIAYDTTDEQIRQ